MPTHTLTYKHTFPPSSVNQDPLLISLFCCLYLLRSCPTTLLCRPTPAYWKDPNTAPNPTPAPFRGTHSHSDWISEARRPRSLCCLRLSLLGAGGLTDGQKNTKLIQIAETQDQRGRHSRAAKKNLHCHVVFWITKGYLYVCVWDAFGIVPAPEHYTGQNVRKQVI